jgi:hypothetical protein
MVGNDFPGDDRAHSVQETWPIPDSVPPMRSSPHPERMKGKTLFCLCKLEERFLNIGISESCNLFYAMTEH